MKTLSGLRVLIIRSARPDDPLAAALSAAGANVMSYPILAIEALDANLQVSPQRMTSDLVSQQQAPGCYDTIIFVSRHAVNYGVAPLRQAGIDFDKVEVAALGPTTAEMLGEQGIAALHPVDQTSTESLLAIPEMERVSGQRILIVRGKGGRETLKDTLVARGADVSYCDVYRRVADYRHADGINLFLDSDEATVVVAHSGEILAAFARLDATGLGCTSLAPKTGWDLPCLVPGARVAQLAGELGFKQVIIAASAVAADMEQALRDWYTCPSH
ncbi:MAG: uroporphyrinogen-III synthase [Porticoccaceae bacterium]|nr:uroporphyrinogen-III synthase [Porticoccaceae bacterium]